MEAARWDPLADAPLTERRLRAMATWLKWLTAALLFAFSAFHLYTGTTGAQPASVQRGVHLAFALGLAFVLFPALSPVKAGDRFASDRAAARRRRRRRDSTGWRRAFALLTPPNLRRMIDGGRPAGAAARLVNLIVDLVLALAGAGAAGYVVWNHEALANRAGAPTSLDLFVGTAALLLILEATRRAISPPLTFVTLGFLAYAFFGHHIPGDWGHREKTFEAIIGQTFFSTEGVFGTPLAVSATFVFLFVLFGAALSRSGAGQYLIDAAFAVMGRLRGGPAKASVLASALMGSISGSSIANTVTTGALTIPLMKKAGFKSHTAGAVEVAASTNGQLMPPVMGAAAFIMAEITGLPYSQIIIAAALPAVLSYVAIFTMVHLEARRTGIRATDPSRLPRLWRTLWRGLHLNIPFLALLGMLLIWRVTEVRAATYAIWATLALYLLAGAVMLPTHYGFGEGPEARHWPTRMKRVALRLLAAFRDGAMSMIGIACACACCGIIIGVVTLTGLGPKLTTLIAQAAGESLLLALLLTALACIVLGIGLPTTATYIIMATLTAPAIAFLAQEAGMAPAGPVALTLAIHLFVFYYGILADDTPPVGLCAYAAAGIAGSDPVRTGLTSFRFDLAAFTLPLIFFYNPELLLQGDPGWKLAAIIPAAVLGMGAFAAALQGFILAPVRWYERLALVAAAGMLVSPTLWMDGVGALLLAAVVAINVIRARSTARVRSNAAPPAATVT